MRVIPKKNYIILLLIVIGVVVLTFLLHDEYQRQQDNKYISVMPSFITEVKVDDIENYVQNNPTVVLYISDSKDDNLDELENEIKEYLIEQNIQKYFVYFDISDEGGNDLTTFESKYNINLDYGNLPILVAMNDGKITDVFNEEDINISKISIFLAKTGVIESD